MADFEMPQTLAASVGTPAASSWKLYFDSALAAPVMKDANAKYTAIAPFGATTITASSAGINTTLTLITSALKIPANTMKVGSSYRVRIFGTCTSTVANTSTFALRIGPNNTTGDASIATVVPTAAASGTQIPFCIEFDVTVRGALGATCSVSAAGKLLNNGVTGISATNGIVGLPAQVNIDSTVDNFINVSMVTAAVTTTNTIIQAVSEITKA